MRLTLAPALRPALVLVLASCAAAGPRGDAAPSAIVVAPAPLPAKGGGVLDPAPAAGEEAPPFEVALDAHRMCVRSSGRVHCTSDVSAERALTASPALEGIEDAVSVSLGVGFGCVATRGGAVLCFGDNMHGQLGAKLRAEKSEKPVRVPGITNAKRVVAGARHACALLTDGTVRCWGQNDTGQTGAGVSYLSAARELVEPDAVANVGDAVSVAAAANTTCAATAGREVTCWGRVLLGGDDRSMGAVRNAKAAIAPELARVEELSAGDGAFCGIVGGAVHCWGELYSLVANVGGRASKLVDVGVSRARRVRVAHSHACALLFDGDVTCWGGSYSGALGRGETTGYGTLGPEVVRGVSSVVDLAVGGDTSCAVTSARDVYCWGTWPHAVRGPTKEALPVKMRVFQ